MNKQLIQTVVTRLVETYKPQSIFIFGSFAWGKPDDESDLDLLVVVEHSEEKPYKRILKGLKSLRGLRFPKDILVYTKSEFEEMAKERASF
ncbi:MAG: nucleotidyltransferase domain-containing protein [Acidobacteria bacterium]|jgi:predicted nucleotidyltransferase|nr:nucleotidyltransferase domain-containing protein [Acidobacteriota bacterium]